MNKIIYISVLLFFISGIASAQNNKELKPEAYFDFWIGEWDLSYKQSDGSIARAENAIERILSDRVIKENFEVLSGQNKGYIGKSWSVYNPSTKTWKQTWVDNQGGYLTFDGKMDGDKRIFERIFQNNEGKLTTQRMVFYNIEENSFTWDWEQSVNNGEDWTLLWRIEYERK